MTPLFLSKYVFIVSLHSTFKYFTVDSLLYFGNDNSVWKKILLQDMFYIIYLFYKQNRKIQTVEFERVKCLRLTDFSRLESFSLQWKDKKKSLSLM